MAATPVSAQDPLAAVLAAVETLDRARADFEQRGGDGEVAQLTAVILAYEDGLAALRLADRRVKLLAAASESILSRETDALTRLLGALQSAGDPQAAENILHPGGPLAAARAALLMADVVPELDARAAAVRERLDAITELDRANTRSEAELKRARSDVVSARLALSRAVRENAVALEPDAAKDVLNDLAVSGAALEEFAIALTESPRAPALSGPDEFLDRLGTYALPVKGSILRTFNVADTTGVNRPGLAIASREFSLVSLPFAASLRFRGQLDGYGNVMILEAAPGYLLIVTGLETVYAREGEVLPAGAPLGLMGGAEENRFDNGNVGRESLSETLYVEARENGTPVDPATWFAMDKERN